ncbi:hypothetical protein FQR65_LT20701 [Abscondita terminalis]|nr:hypothetical protein FQR65_LT20701 [Abscondita terminalis]
MVRRRRATAPAPRNDSPPRFSQPWPWQFDDQRLAVGFRGIPDKLDQQRASVRIAVARVCNLGVTVASQGSRSPLCSRLLTQWAGRQQSKPQSAGGRARRLGNERQAPGRGQRFRDDLQRPSAAHRHGNNRNSRSSEAVQSDQIQITRNMGTRDKFTGPDLARAWHKRTSRGILRHGAFRIRPAPRGQALPPARRIMPSASMSTGMLRPATRRVFHAADKAGVSTTTLRRAPDGSEKRSTRYRAPGDVPSGTRGAVACIHSVASASSSGCTPAPRTEAAAGGRGQAPARCPGSHSGFGLLRPGQSTCIPERFPRLRPGASGHEWSCQAALCGRNPCADQAFVRRWRNRIAVHAREAAKIPTAPASARPAAATAWTRPRTLSKMAAARLPTISTVSWDVIAYWPRTITGMPSRRARSGNHPTPHGTTYTGLWRGDTVQDIVANLATVAVQDDRGLLRVWARPGQCQGCCRQQDKPEATVRRAFAAGSDAGAEKQGAGTAETGRSAATAGSQIERAGLDVFAAGQYASGLSQQDGLDIDSVPVPAPVGTITVGCAFGFLIPWHALGATETGGRPCFVRLRS